MNGIVFPGQGSQRPGMGQDLHARAPAARSVFTRVSEAVGLDLAALCFESDEETLRRTDNAQIALFTCGVAAWEALLERCPGVAARAMAGHSVGEYAALAAAGVVSLEDGARLVRRRGELMATAGQERPGTMAAVLGMEPADLERVCGDVAEPGICVIANDNSPGQLVVSGDVEAVAAATALATERGAKRVIPLNVSGAFHSPLMADSARAMGDALRAVTWHVGSTPVYSNVTAQPGADWPDLLGRQLMSPVRWTESVQRMSADGVRTYVECGSGEVLSGLLRRIDREASALKVLDAATLDETAARLSGVPA